jgi:hypothetical protein
MQPIRPEWVFNEPGTEQQGTIRSGAGTQHQRLGTGVCQKKVHIKRVWGIDSVGIDRDSLRSVPGVSIRPVLKEIRGVVVHLGEEEPEAVGCRISRELQGGAAPRGGPTGAKRGMREPEEGGGGEVEGNKVTAEIGSKEEEGAGGGEKIRIIKSGKGAEREAKRPAGGRGVETEEGVVARRSPGEEKEPGRRGEGGIEVVEAAEIGRRHN